MMRGKLNGARAFILIVEASPMFTDEILKIFKAEQ